MGNQPGKVSVKSSKYITDVDSKNSRTNWIAGELEITFRFGVFLAYLRGIRNVHRVKVHKGWSIFDQFLPTLNPFGKISGF